MELVVVLAILAALATAAAVATDRVLVQKRFDLTRETLDAARRSVLGRYAPGETTSESQPSVEGFVADLGRLPIAFGTQTETQAAELWANPRNLTPFGLKQSIADPDVWLACGWRGPYLQLALGETRLLDGWGRPMLPLTVDSGGAPIPVDGADQPIIGLASLGSDGTVGASSGDAAVLSEDFSVLWHDAAVSPWYVDVQFTVSERDENGDLVPPSGEGTLVVRLYGPNPTTGEIGSRESSPQSGPFVEPAVASFAAVPIGPKVVRAYWLDEAGEVALKSSPRRIEISRSGVAQWELTIPSTAPSPEEESPDDDDSATAPTGDSP